MRYSEFAFHLKIKQSNVHNVLPLPKHSLQLYVKQSSIHPSSSSYLGQSWVGIALRAFSPTVPSSTFQLLLGDCGASSGQMGFKVLSPAGLGQPLGAASLVVNGDSSSFSCLCLIHLCFFFCLFVF